MKKLLPRLIASILLSLLYIWFLNAGIDKLRTQMNDALTATGTLPW